jgi:hypothetical protein
MGIFKRKLSSAELAKIDQKISVYLGDELTNSVNEEYEIFESGIQDRKSEGLTDDSFQVYEDKQKKSLEHICKFINNTIGIDFTTLRPLEHVWPNWVDLQLFKEEFESVNNPFMEVVINELEEVCIYHANCVITGNFIMMPGATMQSSKSYRSYLLGNNLNGDLKWGWEKDEKNLREMADSEFTQLLARFVTAVHDKYGRNKIHRTACVLAVALAHSWERSAERKSL